MNNNDEKRKINYELMLDSKALLERLKKISKRIEQESFDVDRMGKKKDYLERVLIFAKTVNKEYADFLEYKLRISQPNFKIEKNFEWECAKNNLLTGKEDSPTSQYTYGTDLDTIELLINEAKKVLEYAKELNPEFFELLKSDLLNHDLINLENNWHSINALAYHSLVVKENEGIDLTIDQLMSGPYANNYIYGLLSSQISEEQKKIFSEKCKIDFDKNAKAIIYNMKDIDFDKHAKAIIENKDSGFNYLFSKECEVNPGKKK